MGWQERDEPPLVCAMIDGLPANPHQPKYMALPQITKTSIFSCGKVSCAPTVSTSLSLCPLSLAKSPIIYFLQGGRLSSKNVLSPHLLKTRVSRHRLKFLE